MSDHWVHSKNFLFAAFLASIALGGVASFRRQQAMAMSAYATAALPAMQPLANRVPVWTTPNVPGHPKSEEAAPCAKCRETCRQPFELNHSQKLSVKQGAIHRFVPDLPEVYPARQ